MKKLDLKNWMVVEWANGDFFIVDKDNEMLRGMKIWNSFEGNYNEDLTHKEYPGLSIVRVYLNKKDRLETFFDKEELELLWDRNNPKQHEIKKIRGEMEALAMRLKNLESEA